MVRFHHSWVATLFLSAVGLLCASALPAFGQEPLRVRRNLFGMHNLKDGGPDYLVGMDWTKNLVGSGFVFDWVTDPLPWVQAAFQRNLIPCIRVQDCNGGCTPNPGYPGQVASVILNYKLANPQYADRLVYLQLWNEPSDPRDSVSPEAFADYLVAAYNSVKSAEAGAAQSNPNVAGTMLCMTPGQNGPSWWEQAYNHNPNAKFAFDLWGTHPYPEASPPHYNLHNGNVYIETSKTIDSYLMDLDIVAKPHGSPAKSRRGFRVMITETAYGDHLGISYEGWPKTTRQLAADYNVAAFGTWWYQWPEIVAAQPFLLCNLSWSAFSWVQIGSGTNPDSSPTAPWPQFTATRAERQRLELQGKLAPARLSPYRGPVGHIAGAVTRSDTGAIVPRATIFTDGYEFGHVSLYDGLYEVHDVPVGTYTLSCSKQGYQTASQQITATAGATTTANFNLLYTGRTSKGFYFVDSFNGDAGCGNCSLFAPFHAQSFTTPSDVAFIKYAACKPNVDGISIRFSIRESSPTGAQIGTSVIGTLDPGVSGIMIGAEWPDGQEPAVQPNTTYFLRFERTDGQGVYCYASNANPYSGGNAYPGGNAQPGIDFYGLIRGLRPAVAGVTGTIAGVVRDLDVQMPLSGATVSTVPPTSTAITNAEGEYTISNVPVGTYSVTASAPKYAPQTRSNQVVNTNQTTTVWFGLVSAPTTGTIMGVVKDAQNNGIVGATVRTTTGGYLTTSGAGGSYMLANVAPATYTVQAAKSGYQTNQVTNVNVVAGQTATIDITLSPPAPFAGICNGNFEGGFTNDPDADHQSANCWHRFSLSGTSKAGPHYSTTNHSPNWAQTIYESSWSAGIYQQVTNASIASLYTGSVWVQGVTADLSFRVGIDPTGGTNAESSNVQWSSWVTPGTTWTQVSKQVAAQSTTITLFLAGQNVAAANRNAYFDDATLTEQYVPPDSPTIVLSPTSLTRTAQVGTDAAGQTFTIANGGSGTLGYSIGDDAAWLSVSPADGTATTETDTIAVTYTTGGLTAGTYHATITVADPNATNTPQTIAVTLTVTSAQSFARSDFDQDGDVDQEDFGHLQACISGTAPQTEPQCADSLFDGDIDVDVDDVNLFMNCMRGPDIEVSPGCEEP